MPTASEIIEAEGELQPGQRVRIFWDSIFGGTMSAPADVVEVSEWLITTRLAEDIHYSETKELIHDYATWTKGTMVSAPRLGAPGWTRTNRVTVCIGNGADAWTQAQYREYVAQYLPKDLDPEPFTKQFTWRYVPELPIEHILDPENAQIRLCEELIESAKRNEYTAGWFRRPFYMDLPVLVQNKDKTFGVLGRWFLVYTARAFGQTTIPAIVGV
jgi:hypothetical protein